MATPRMDATTTRGRRDKNLPEAGPRCLSLPPDGRWQNSRRQREMKDGASGVQVIYPREFTGETESPPSASRYLPGRMAFDAWSDHGLPRRARYRGLVIRRDPVGRATRRLVREEGVAFAA
jgi:hypothetical protein